MCWARHGPAVAGGHEVRGARSPEKADQLAPRAPSPSPSTCSIRSVRRGRRVPGRVHMATNIPLTRVEGHAWAERPPPPRGHQVIADACRDAGVEVLVKETVSFFYEDGGDEWIDEDWPIERQPFSDASLDAEDTTLAFTGDGRRGVVLRFGLFYSHDARALEESLKMAKLGFGPMIGPADGWRGVDPRRRRRRPRSSRPSTRPPAPTTWPTSPSPTASGTPPSPRRSASRSCAPRPAGDEARRQEGVGARRQPPHRLDQVPRGHGLVTPHPDARVGLKAVAAAHQAAT